MSLQVLQDTRIMLAYMKVARGVTLREFAMV